MIPTSYTAPQSYQLSSFHLFECFNSSGTDSLERFHSDKPNSSILFDGNVPTSTNDFTEQTLTEQTYTPVKAKEYVMNFDFAGQPDYTGVGTVEFVMFNCADEGRLLDSMVDDDGVEYSLDVWSCHKLVRKCVSFQTIRPQRFSLRFKRPCWMMAEMVFYRSNCTCDGEISQSREQIEPVITDKSKPK